MRFPSLVSRFAAVVLVLSLVSCASDDRPHRGPMPKPPPPVAGESSYFGGEIVASIRVAMEFRHPAGGDDSERSRRGGGGGRRSGGGSMSLGGGAGPMHFNGGEGRGGHGGGRGEGAPAESDGGRGPRVMPASGVPLMIHVQLRNRGAAPVEVAVRDFASPLGNFVVQPATLTVPPGESAEFSPMTSFVQGDLPDEMPATLVLRVDGKTEKQIVVLRPVAPDRAPVSRAPDPESRPIQK